MDDIVFSLNKDEEDPHVLMIDEFYDEENPGLLHPLAGRGERFMCYRAPSCENAALLNTTRETVVSCHKTGGQCEIARQAALKASMRGSSSSSGGFSCVQNKSDDGPLFAYVGECPPYERPDGCPSYPNPQDPDGERIQLVYMAYAPGGGREGYEDISPLGCMQVKCVGPGGLEGTGAVWGNRFIDLTGGVFCCGVTYSRDSEGNLVAYCPGGGPGDGSSGGGQGL